MKRRQPMTKQQMLLRNPLMRAQIQAELDAREIRARADLENSIHKARALVYGLQDGQDATQALAKHAYYIGLAAEVCFHALGLHHAQTKRMHGALRNVHAMCMRGYHWQYAMAPAIETALAEALDIVMQHPDVAMQWEPAADAYRERVLAHTVKADQVPGAELYRAQPTATASR